MRNGMSREQRLKEWEESRGQLSDFWTMFSVPPLSSRKQAIIYGLAGIILVAVIALIAEYFDLKAVEAPTVFGGG